MKRFLLALIASMSLIDSSIATTSAPLTLTDRDLSAKFLAFYELAVKPGVDAEARWKLWKEHYDYAAVPPGERGDKMARELLDQAWSRYPSVLPKVRAGVTAIKPSNEAIVRSIDKILNRDRPLDLTVVNFVGALEGNAYTYSRDGKVTVVMPMEIDSLQRQALATHELTHAVHIAQGTITGAWERTIAETIISEGLAMHVSRLLMPKYPVTKHLEHTPGWLKLAEARRAEILRNIKPALGKSDGEIVMRFTIGPGPSGIEREAYYAGWLVVEHWLKQGRKPADIVRIAIANHVKEVETAIDALLKKTSPKK
jgi:Predicted Zn-dependent protease (DUF2268)